MRYRVDRLPRGLGWVWQLTSWGLAIMITGVCWTLRKTCKVTREGQDGGDPLLHASGTIFCAWHDIIIPFWCVYAGKRFVNHIWMNHPAWYMLPIHKTLRLFGVRRLALGSSGHDGRNAAAEIVEALRQGASTVVFADGPYGPPRVLKKGVLHMAQQSGAPIVVVSIDTPRARIIRRSWEGKRIPRPGSTLTVRFSEPIYVAEGELADAALRVEAALSRSGVDSMGSMGGSKLGQVAGDVAKQGNHG